jgi:hypothetical protein
MHALRDDSLISAFSSVPAAHLVAQKPKDAEKKPFQVRLAVTESALDPPRPVTAPIQRIVPAPRSRPTTTSGRRESVGEGNGADAGAGGNDGANAAPKRKVISAPKKRGTSAQKKTSRGNSAESQKAAPEPAEASSDEDSQPDKAVADSTPVVEEPFVAMAFNPRKPSVFAASMYNDQYSLAARQSTFTSIESLLHREPSAKLTSLKEEASEKARAPTLSQKQRSERMRSDSNSDASGSLASTKSKSFSSLPAVEKSGPLLKQKSISIKKI